MNICELAALASSKFEKNNTDLKRRYLLKNIELINKVMSCTPGYCGSFGTGYPFYVLDSNLEGELPIISEQLRYNKELINESKKTGATDWVCAKCLLTRGDEMPDLKQICKPCPRIKDTIKPRKVINRLPDIDMWMVCADRYFELAQIVLSQSFDKLGMHTSDVNPVQTIYDIQEIADDLEKGNMPQKLLPLDIHIIPYSQLSKLLDEIPFVLESFKETEEVPYLPIHPVSLRKTWQYDDTAYNFVLDYMYSLTPFNFEEKILRKLNFSRKIIGSLYTEEELRELLNRVSSDSVKRRFENNSLKKSYDRRIQSWKK